MSAAAAANQRERKTNSNAGAKRRLRLWFCFIILFVGWAGYAFYSQSSELHEKSKQLADIRAKEQATKDSLNQIKYEINRLNDPEYIGQLARKKYGLYKPGETPIRKSTGGN
ncbi:septation ring formation regulator EzrA [Paenibacillus yonginensis]|uniref:Septation ring formation regulator EzrA n=1 Tax=Paenibacillus yonginensis TaxID=1462996 RepID=A0A1B1N4K0_9BACL|nr:septum formation initiator family protein [Paenibacillus yonginensis]ANS76370.1 septation ring formation regulator EzrA [Paenibacillus yonginensis]